MYSQCTLIYKLLYKYNFSFLTQYKNIALMTWMHNN